MRTKKPYIFTVFLVMLLSTVVQAQFACNALVTQALQAVGTNCDGLPINTVCYGYNLVQASFAQEVPENFFVQPADRASLESLAVVQTAGLDASNDRWGVAVVRLQANVPNTLPGQAVTFILMGDAELENAVLPEDTFTPPDPIIVTLISETPLRSAPALSANVIATAPITVGADGISADGLWVRVTFDELFGWVAQSALADTSLIAGLPTLDGTQRMPMQAFYLRTNVGRTECAEASDALLVQGPKGGRIDLTVNGAIVNFGSTILFRVLSGDRMEIVVIDGDIIVKQNQNDPNPKQLFTGQRSEVCLAPPYNLGVDGTANDRIATCEWSEPENIPQEDLAGSWCQLTNIDEVMLNYGITTLDCPEEVVLEQEETPSPPQTFGQNQPPAETQEPNTGIQNWCDAGGKWEGQCDNPDPATREWYYNAGWYFAQVDKGNLTLAQVPSQYYTPPAEAVASPAPVFTINIVCEFATTTIGAKIAWSNANTMDTILITVDQDAPVPFSMAVNSPMGLGANGLTGFVTGTVLANTSGNSATFSASATTTPGGLFASVAGVVCTVP